MVRERASDRRTSRKERIGNLEQIDRIGCERTVLHSVDEFSRFQPFRQFEGLGTEDVVTPVGVEQDRQGDFRLAERLGRLIGRGLGFSFAKLAVGTLRVHILPLVEVKQ